MWVIIIHRHWDSKKHSTVIPERKETKKASSLCLPWLSALKYTYIVVYREGSQAEHRCIASLRRQRQWEFKEQRIRKKGEIHARAQDLSLSVLLSLWLNTKAYILGVKLSGSGQRMTKALNHSQTLFMRHLCTNVHSGKTSSTFEKFCRDLRKVILK